MRSDRFTRRLSRIAVASLALLAAVSLCAAPSSAAPADGGTGSLIVYVSPSTEADVEVWQNGEFDEYMGYRTDEDGSNLHFELDTLPAGSYQLFVDVNDDTGPVARGWYVSATSTAPTISTATAVTVTAGGTTTLSWKLSGGTTIGGTVTDSAGRPISGLCVDVTDPSDNALVIGGATAANGSFGLPHTLPGSYLLSYYDCDLGDTFAHAPWGYPLTYWNGTTSGAPTRSGATMFHASNGTSASITVAANGLIQGSLKYPSDTSFEQVQAYAGRTVKSGATASASATVSGSSYSIVVPAGTYHVAFYCQGRSQAATCSTGVYNWYGGGGFMAKAKRILVKPGTALKADEGAIPSVVAENYVHLRRKSNELVSVYCMFSRNTCSGSEVLALTVPPTKQDGRPSRDSYTTSFAVQPHASKVLSYGLPKAARTAISRHLKIKATLTLKVKGQSTVTQSFSIS